MKARLFGISILSLIVITNPVPAQTSKAVPVAGGVTSPTLADAFPMLSPDGRYLYFSRQKSNRGWSHQTILYSELRNDIWSEPQVASFSGGTYSDRAPRFSPDGSKLYFTSNRPRHGGASSDYNIWVVDAIGPERWSEPHWIPGDVNSPAADMHVSVSSDGTLYVASSREGGHGRGDLYRFRESGAGFGPGDNLGDPFNSELSQADLYVSPDEDMIIFAMTDHPQGYGGDDLWVSFLNNGAWTDPRNLGPDVNESDYEYGPSISPNGEWLYFTSHRSGAGDIYRIRVADVEALQR